MTPHPTQRRARAFTLIELLLAVTIFGIVLVAINTVFYSALRLRARVTDLLESSRTLTQALAVIRDDLRGVVPPAGLLAASFKIGPVTSRPGTAQGLGIEFFTSTGGISDDAPWGEVQKVTYALREPANRNVAVGKDLIRSVTRNLLTTVAEQPVETLLLSDVQRLEIACYTSQDWRDTWDTTLTDVGLPAAIRIRLQMAGRQSLDNRNQKPIELIVPLVAQSNTNLVSASTTGTSSF